MRRRATAAIPAILAALGLWGAFVGCSGDAATAASTTTTVGGAGGAGSGGATATGGSGGQGGEAPAPDGGPVDAAVDAAAGEAIVRVYDDGDPKADVPVLFHGADGALALATKTGADGKAVGPASGSATVTVALEGAHELVSIFGVVPGDDLFVGSPVALHRKIGVAKIAASQQVAGAHDFVLDLGMKSAVVGALEPPVEIDLPASALLGGKPYAVVAFARDGSGVPTVTAWAEGPALDADGVSAVTLPAWTFDVESFFLRVSNVLPGASFAQARSAPVGPNGLAHFALNPWQVVAPAKLNIFLFAEPKGFGSLTEIVAGASFGDQGADANSSVVKRIKDRPYELDFDLAAHTLPQVEGATVKGAAGQGPTLDFANKGAFAAADGVFVSSSWDAPVGSVRWLAIAPVTAKGALACRRCRRSSRPGCPPPLRSASRS